jgi:NitT/TauT family transport system permease protein
MAAAIDVFAGSTQQPSEPVPHRKQVGAFTLALFRLRHELASSAPYVGLLGVAGLLLLWYLLTELFDIPRFNKLPGPVAVWTEFTSPKPTFGISLYTPDYYKHILWKKTFRDYAFPMVEIVRPIPVLAWVPLAILIFSGFASREAPIVFLAFLAAFFATALNTLLGVESIDEVYFRAARCLGSKPRHIFWRVVLPGALPFIFTGLQIGVGVAWFSLVAAEMVSGEYGLGFLIWDSYVLSQFQVIIIAMVTLGVIGYSFSAIIRIVGRLLMRWAA